MQNVDSMTDAEDRSQEGESTDLEVELRKAERWIEYGSYGKVAKKLGELKAAFPSDSRPWLMDIKMRIAKGGVPTVVFKLCQEVEEIYEDDPDVVKQINAFRKIVKKGQRADAEPVSVKALPRVAAAGKDIGNIRIKKKPGAKAVILVFAAVGEGESIFAKLVPILDRMPAHYVQLSDPSRLVGLGGYEGLGESYEETVSALKKMCAELPAEQIVCFGHSAGGYSAIRYGLRLGATHIISSAGPTAFSPEVLQWDMRLKLVAARVVRRLNLNEDLADLIRKYEKPVLITHFYGGDNEQDSRHAANLKGLASVKLMKVEGVEVHGVIHDLIEDGSIEKCLSEAMNGAGH